MARQTGHDGVIIFDGVTVLSMLGWRATERSVNVETTASGDLVVDRAHLWNDFTITGHARIVIPAGSDPYVIPVITGPGSKIGTKVPVVLKLESTEGASGFASCDLALIQQFEVVSEAPQPQEWSFELVAAGTPLEWDLTP